MSERAVRYQTFEYRENQPFVIYDVPMKLDAFIGDRLLPHWHDELEIDYLYHGCNRHYIDGKCFDAEENTLVVTNCESVHKIVRLEEKKADKERRSIILMISRQFIDLYFPEYREICFKNKYEDVRPEIEGILLQLAAYAAKTSYKSHDHLYASGLLQQLLYYLCEDGGQLREGYMNVNEQKDIERLKGVLQYVTNHYKEKLSSAKVAEKFYFSQGNFSRYFKKCTDMTFQEYVLVYRLKKAGIDLLGTEKSILQIALDNGFPDTRSLINSFKKYYGMTPLKYRKQYENQ